MAPTWRRGYRLRGFPRKKSVAMDGHKRRKETNEKIDKGNGNTKEVLDICMEPKAKNVQDKKDGEDLMIVEETLATKEVQEGYLGDEDLGLEDYEDIEPVED
ncbi:hypothetical protein L1987_14725 [Smallanthus sonchifolius]|uniref:Uncharacterized protein n=1 Tax=Smallanthus sonchifolius TaxID=185202 RepID=A0ACB9J5U2_9ASTR|nr:hypothetical protein L1987_14725 [Smallanthus sonchifolius]